MDLVKFLDKSFFSKFILFVQVTIIVNQFPNRFEISSQFQNKWKGAISRRGENGNLVARSCGCRVVTRDYPRSLH